MTQSHATDYTSAANYEASVNRDEEARKRILAREATFPLRSATDRLMKILAFGAMVFGLFWLVWILVTLVQNGVGAMSLTLSAQFLGGAFVPLILPLYAVSPAATRAVAVRRPRATSPISIRISGK